MRLRRSPRVHVHVIDDTGETKDACLWREAARGGWPGGAHTTSCAVNPVSGKAAKAARLQCHGQCG